jgi:polysaccharide biosynthesis transport protein
VDVDRNELQRQVDAATGELSQLLETRSPEHPDVQRLQREVDTLRATLSEPPPPRSQAAPATSSTPDNPAYIQIRAQLEAAQNDIGATRRLTGQLQAQVLDYRNKINVSPQIEKQYRELLRDYDTARVQYQEIRSKQAEAQVAQNLESDRKGERFTLIEPPIRPIRPVSPNRVLIVILGAILALGLAAGLVILVDKFDPSVRDGADFMQLVGTVPVALVPLILTVEDQQRGRNRRIWLVVGSVAALAALLTLVHFTLWPLEAIGSALLRRFGI